ncbi:hypothetical protein DPMN_145319 [Dreissena polymorpha]|uniref:Uncharacterized protein n=1 Tax=Dreissena polymorpha TaxID=45954 RepID=A0A9D4F3S0_DREPO|nr:hypothetical protein DPMN_145319 [Dreissena polymorpha]
MSSLYNDKPHVIIHHQRSNGYQYTSTMGQLGIYASTPVSVLYSAYSRYKGPIGSYTLYIFVGFNSHLMTYIGAMQGWKFNGEELTFYSCDGNPNIYIAFVFNTSTDVVGGQEKLMYQW